MISLAQALEKTVKKQFFMGMWIACGYSHEETRRIGSTFFNSSDTDAMSFETIISVGLVGWMTMGFILMGLGIW
ncbi:hypothetical protein YTPLAS18_18910 [Nitrospira sp.]|nr:hypothetical protein YTPLAS18_18910 [Nitrospira sp.]